MCESAECRQVVSRGSARPSTQCSLHELFPRDLLLTVYSLFAVSRRVCDGVGIKSRGRFKMVAGEHSEESASDVERKRAEMDSEMLRSDTTMDHERNNNSFVSRRRKFRIIDAVLVLVSLVTYLLDTVTGKIYKYC